MRDNVASSRIAADSISKVGKAIATAFAQAGASSVAILGRREDRLKTALAEISEKVPKATLLYAVADITKREELEKAFTTFRTQAGAPHILVSNAAVLPSPGPIASAEAEELARSFESNVMGALNAAQVFLQHAQALENPMILNVSSAIAHMAPLPKMGLYAASKSANAKMFDYLAVENPGVHVVNVQPGLINSGMNYNGMALPWDERKLFLMPQHCHYVLC